MSKNKVLKVTYVDFVLLMQPCIHVQTCPNTCIHKTMNNLIKIYEGGLLCVSSERTNNWLSCLCEGAQHHSHGDR